jgi:hypothetical protein
MKVEQPSVTDFAPGDRVRYIPNHAFGDAQHPDCENGIVTSKNDTFVFVRYYAKGGMLKFTAQATDPADLIKTL